jgi:hypothetical protein
LESMYAVNICKCWSIVFTSITTLSSGTTYISSRKLSTSQHQYSIILRAFVLVDHQLCIVGLLRYSRAVLWIVYQSIHWFHYHRRNHQESFICTHSSRMYTECYCSQVPFVFCWIWHFISFANIMQSKTILL